MFLTDDQIRALTQRRQRAAQAAQLRAMGFAFKVRADGTLVVLQAHVEQALGAAPTHRAQNVEPDFSKVKR